MTGVVVAKRKKTGGRPVLSDEDRKDTIKQVRLTATEGARWEEAAWRLRSTISEELRVLGNRWADRVLTSHESPTPSSGSPRPSKNARPASASRAKGRSK